MLEGTCLPAAGSRRPWRWLCLTYLATLTLFRVVYLARLCPYDLAQDEAHYWDWGRNLDWSYYSKGPLIAWLIRGSCELFGSLSLQWTGGEMFGLRLPAVACGTFALAGLFTLTVQTLRSEKLGFMVVLLASIMPIISAVSTILTIDSPFVCCWVWALVAGHRAFERNELWAWGAAGVVFGIGILAKYTMTLWLFSFCLYLRFSPGYRERLHGRGFWLMTALGALACVPILIWNASHDWVSFRHVAGQAGLVKDAGLPRSGPFFGRGILDFIAGQFALMVGWWFIAWIAAMIRFRPTRTSDTSIRYLWWMSLPTVLVFFATSVRNCGQVNWPVAGYLSGTILIAAWLHEALFAANGFLRFLIRVNLLLACVFSLGLSIIAHDTGMIRPLLVTLGKRIKPNDSFAVRVFDPSCRLRGWKYLAQQIDSVREQVRSEEGREPVLAAMYWNIPGEIGFYCDGHPKAYSLGPFTCERFNQYDLWRPNPVRDGNCFKGQTFIVVNGHEATLRGYFPEANLAKQVIYREDGVAISTWTIWVCRRYIGLDNPNLEWRTGY